MVGPELLGLVGARVGEGGIGLFERLLTAQFAAGGKDRFDDVLVTRTATQVAIEAAANLGFGRVGVVAQELIDGDDTTWRAEATLQTVFFPERLLDRVQLAVWLGEAFDGLDVGAVGLNGEDGARLHGDAVDQDRARAALRRVAADVRSG